MILHQQYITIFFQEHVHPTYFDWMEIPNSASCEPSTLLGASVSRSLALAVFGNAIVSRRFVEPDNNMTIRSNPKAIPPCGGVPYSNASNKNPNCSHACSSAESKRFEHFLLDITLIDTQRSSAQLIAI